MVKFSEKLSCVVNLLTSDLVLIKTKPHKYFQHDLSFVQKEKEQPVAARRHDITRGQQVIQGSGSKAQGDIGHMAAPSLGHYAALSFVVRGKGIEHIGSEDRGQMTDDR
jgi:hypothetical protein